jgi:branched-chain amino acid:cation transporter, LIVCS family
MRIEESTPKKQMSIILIGMALFSMFFGAGNLVFPLLVGESAGNQISSAIGGLAISAVAFPFLGLIAMMLCLGNLNTFLQRIGKLPAFLLLFVLQATQGPLGCMPRLLTLMHANIRVYIPSISLLAFSLIMTVVVFFLAYRPSKLVSILGTVLTPVLLGMFAILVFVGLINPPDPIQVTGTSMTYFKEGFNGGYQTMDLILALLFSTVVIPLFFKGTHGMDSEEVKRIIRKKMIMASSIAAGLLMLTYIGLSWIASRYHVVGNPEDLLSLVSLKVLGPIGGLVAIITCFVACLTTMISMAVVFSRYLRKEIFRGKISGNLSLILTLLMTSGIACLGFAGIMRITSPILEVLYPILIVLCFYNIIKRPYKEMDYKELEDPNL